MLGLTKPAAAQAGRGPQQPQAPPTNRWATRFKISLFNFKMFNPQLLQMFSGSLLFSWKYYLVKWWSPMCTQVLAASTENRYEFDWFAGRASERPVARHPRQTSTKITWSGSFNCCWFIRGDCHCFCEGNFTVNCMSHSEIGAGWETLNVFQ